MLQPEVPTFRAPEGVFSVDYRSYDGIVVLGSGDWMFQTKWSNAGNGSIHVYNDRGPRVAVAPFAKQIEDVTADVFSRSDFTSRVRTPRVGEVVLFLNGSDYAAAIEIKRVTVTPESRPGTQLNGRYRILTDKSRDFSMQVNGALTYIWLAADDALATLEEVEKQRGATSAIPGMGHNNPPQDAALTRHEYEELRSSMQQLRESERGSLAASTLKASETSIASASSKIKEWLAERFKLIREGFYRQFGAAAALALMALWAKLNGQLEVLLEAIATTGRALFGWH